MIGIAIGALGTLATMAARARAPRPSDVREFAPLPMCSISIVLVAADDSAISRAIDAKTGGRGFSHAYLDPCRIDDTGKRVAIDYIPAGGVHWFYPERYAGRGTAVVELDGTLGIEVYGCVRAKLGTPFKVAALAAGVDSDGTCTGLIVHCLPPSLQRRLRRGNRCVSANDLAAFFGVRVGQSARVDGTTLTQQIVRSGDRVYDPQIVYNPGGA